MTNAIKGALYGFAIGDAMGATTEFMNTMSIQRKYGKVTDIVGGGWLGIKAGQVTDDTQMTFCVCNAIEESLDGLNVDINKMLDKCCRNFANWYYSKPIDIGGTCRSVISKCVTETNHKVWHKVAFNRDALGNGSLMRTMPIVLSGLPGQAALSQGRLTHNNKVCDDIISKYYKELSFILNHNEFWDQPEYLYEPVGHVANTYYNALFWAQTPGSFEDAIINAVNAGGDADTIAAVTGSLAGAFYGFDNIPERWINQLAPSVKEQLDKYAKLFEKINKGYVQARVEVV